MFAGRKKGRGQMPKGVGEINALMGKGTEFQGDLKFDGTVRIDGIFCGEIQAAGTLVVGEGARVEAKIHCGTVIVSGEVIGDIEATHRVEALAPARIQGNIQTPVLVINEGVQFDGVARMEGVGVAEKDKKISIFGIRERRSATDETSQAEGQ